MDRLENLEAKVHQKKEEGAQGLSEYMKSLQAQSELLQEQRNLEGLKADTEKKISEVSSRRQEMAEQTDRIKSDTVGKFDAARDAAKDFMCGAKGEIPNENKSFMDKVSETFAPNK